MVQKFQVSVITPVDNAAEFVTRAMESALAKPKRGRCGHRGQFAGRLAEGLPGTGGRA